MDDMRFAPDMAGVVANGSASDRRTTRSDASPARQLRLIPTGSVRMAHPTEAMLGAPWRLLGFVLDGSLHPGGRAATERLLDRADVGPETRLLDVGCGGGEALNLAGDRGARAIGLDHDPPDRRAVRGDMTALPFRDGCFDVVLGECVLCLSPAIERTLSEVNRLLTAGGRLAFSDVTVAGSPPDLPAPIEDLLCLNGRRDGAHIQQRLVDAGFEITEVRSHQQDLLAMRDRLRQRLDWERLEVAFGDRTSRIRDGAAELEAAVESGRIGYLSIIATA